MSKKKKKQRQRARACGSVGCERITLYERCERCRVNEQIAQLLVPAAKAACR